MRHTRSRPSRTYADDLAAVREKCRRASADNLHGRTPPTGIVAACRRPSQTSGLTSYDMEEPRRHGHMEGRAA
ncbi:hypothetical protein ACIOWI_24000 [Streptomyces sp. NPDC087659]|uniref:hypothetical protein n=1 Tax=Streptomyces sp. NPDC087659 TaxID=3365801 RepID=UPI0037F3FBD6